MTMQQHRDGFTIGSRAREDELRGLLGEEGDADGDGSDGYATMPRIDASSAAGLIARTKRRDSSRPKPAARSRARARDEAEPELHVPVTRPLSARALTGTDLLATPVSAIMSRDALQVRDDVPVDSARALFLERGASGAPVVDVAGKVVGFLSLADLLRHEVDGDEADDAAPAARLHVRTREGYEYDLPAGFHVAALPRALTADVMTPFAFCVPLGMPVVQAAALMAYETIQRVVVVEADGTVAGVLSTLDVTAWLARSVGALAPDTARNAVTAALITREGGVVRAAWHEPSTHPVASATFVPAPLPHAGGAYLVGTRRHVA